MHINVLFLVLTFVVILIIVYISETLTAAVLTISLLANLFIISSQLEKRKNMIMSGKNEILIESAPPALHDPTVDDIPTVIDDPNVAPEDHPYAVPEFSAQPTNIYGSQYMIHDAYKNSTRAYDTPLPDGVDGGIYPGIDGANALMARKRARDKQCMDGAAVKDANFYKFHYADELDEAEQKTWWGNKEY